jgi:protein-S-isoprenylcysteine O-methyltransferase Ste14
MIRETESERAKLKQELRAQARFGRTTDGRIDWGHAEQRWRAANNPVTILVLLFNIIVWYLLFTVRGITNEDLSIWGTATVALSVASIVWPVVRFSRNHYRSFVDMHKARGMSEADADQLYRKTYPGD